MGLSSRLINHLDKIIGLIWAACLSSQWNKFAYAYFVVHNYAMATLAEQLAEVQTAISEVVEHGESYNIDTQGKRRVPLKDLLDMEKSLQRRIRAEGGLGRTVAMY